MWGFQFRSFFNCNSKIFGCFDGFELSVMKFIWVHDRIFLVRSRFNSMDQFDSHSSSLCRHLASYVVIFTLVIFCANILDLVVYSQNLGYYMMDKCAV